MTTSARRLAAGTAIVAAMLVTVPSPAHACSMVPSVSMAGVAASLTGQPIPEQDGWVLEGVTVTGLVETTVVHTWEATLDYEAAAVHSVTRAWGTAAEGRPNADRIRGGEPRGPLAERTSCGLEGGSSLGHRSYSVIMDERGSHPVSGPLTPEAEALLSATLGEPDVRDVPTVDDRHPSYDRQHSPADYLTWGRIMWALAVVLFIPVIAFGSWLYSTRRD